MLRIENKKARNQRVAGYVEFSRKEMDINYVFYVRNNI
jgi:hypothetical protein